MQYAKIHAYVRCSVETLVEKGLLAADVGGFSYCHVKGVGEYANYFNPNLLVEHTRFEVFVPVERVDEIVQLITETSNTHQPGDGVIAVMPVTHFFRIRTEHEITDGAETTASTVAASEGEDPCCC